MRLLIGVVCAGMFAGRCLGGYRAVELYELQPPAGWASAEPAFLLSSPQVTAGGQVAGDGSVNNVPGQYQALVWNASGVPIQLNPAGAIASQVRGTNGVQQVGLAIFNQASHALLWNGTTASAVDLNPAGFAQSESVATSGTQQVGDAGVTLTGPAHAMLWTGTASSAVDLNPAATTFSFATGTDGVHQVGYASSGSGNHATLWSGTAASAIDLHPAGLFSSVAWGVSGSEQVGWAEGSASTHAFLWHGSAASAVDLNPAGMYSSVAFGTNGTQQVGEMSAALNAPTHAVVWSGSADSAVDLSLLLPPDVVYSHAFTIDAEGNIFGIALASPQAPYKMYAVEWQVPEPAAVGLLALLIVLGRRTRPIC